MFFLYYGAADCYYHNEQILGRRYTLLKDEVRTDQRVNNAQRDLQRSDIYDFAISVSSLH